MNIARALKPTALLTALATCLLFSGCFRIVEKVEFDSMNSGTFTMITDLSGMYEIMATMGQEEEDPAETEKEFQDMENDMQEIFPRLQEIDGVSNPRTSHDTEKYTARISFDFNSIHALNQGMSVLYSKQLELEEIKQNTYFISKRKSIERTNARDMIDFLLKDMQDENSAETMQFFAEASFDLEYSFPKKIKRVSNKDYNFEKKSKSVSYQYYMFKPDFEEKPIGAVVKF